MDRDILSGIQAKKEKTENVRFNLEKRAFSTKSSEAKAKNTKGKLLESNKIDYESVKKLIDKEVMTLLTRSQQELFNKINPIKENKVAEYKEKIIKLGLSVNSPNNNFFLRKVLDTKNSNDLFSITKNLLINNIETYYDEKLTALFVSKNNGDFSTDKFREEFIELNNRYCYFLKNALDIFALESVDEGVLQIEREVVDLGVSRVNFCDDIVQAVMIRDVVVELLGKGVRVPSSITVTPFVHMGKCGYTSIEIKDGQRFGHVYIQTSNDHNFDEMLKKGMIGLASELRIFDSMPEAVKKAYNEGFGGAGEFQFSTTTDKHQLYHLMGHLMMPQDYENWYKKLSPYELDIASYISKQASSCKGKEIVPEMFSRLMQGDALTPEQMKLYLKLGGIVPLSKFT